MNIGIFTDSHYSSAEITCGCRYNSRSLDKIREAYRIFAEAGCEMVLCLGDLTDTEKTYEAECENLRACAAVIDASGIPTLCVMGNHDAFAMDRYRYSVLAKVPLAPLHKKYGDVDIILLDANYYKDGQPYDGKPGDWTDTMVPQKQVEWLKKELESCGDKTYVFSHQLIDYIMPQNHVIENAEEICAVLASSGKVKGVYQGHYHEGGENVIDGIPYVTLAAMCEGYDNRFAIIEV